MLINTIFVLISLLLALAIHEYAHARAADELGDPTARLLGRLTLNPLKHLDPAGTVLMALSVLIPGGFIIGWGKPVPFDPYNLKSPRVDGMKIALAGPVSNIILAIIGAVMLYIPGMPLLVSAFAMTFIQVNVSLAVFNMVPLPPLDGFRVVCGLLPEETADQWDRLERVGPMLLIFALLPLFGGRSLISIITTPLTIWLLSIFIR